MMLKRMMHAWSRCWWFAAWASLMMAQVQAAESQPSSPTWPASVEKALSRAGTNQTALTQAIAAAPESHRASLAFLLENMPESDLRSLSPVWLAQNVALAHQARETVAWGKSIPDEIFLNDVLPYAVLDEERDAWRAKLYEICLPLVRECKTSGEAALALNKELFGLVKVKYSTARKKPNQNPSETMASGIATCSGLSILLVDACRAVGVPARVAGTPMWANGSGNHTWVEVWDQDWHFVGAAEPDPKGLDQGWFVGNASQALRDKPRNAIYASSFKRTDLLFPLVWAKGESIVPGINVTDRYAASAKPAETNKLKLFVRVYDYPAGKRVEVPVRVRAASGETFNGTSRGETADMNDDVFFWVEKGQACTVEMETTARHWSRAFLAGTNKEDAITFCLGTNPNLTTAPTLPAPAAKEKPLIEKMAREFSQQFSAYFAADASQRQKWSFPARLERQLRDHEAEIKQLAWKAYAAAPIHTAARQEYEAREVRFEQHVSPYTVKTVGTRPTNGWPLFIAMHGGGNAPKELNDSQWKVMQRYYRDHPELGGYLYVALRAPNDTWNGFYDNYVYPLIDNLTRHFLLFGDVNPDKVFIMGYSHGGYGAFAIGPKMPDHFAAVHASAAAPTDGETTAKTLRNTVFTFMVGGKDTAYGRRERCEKFDREIKELRGGQLDIYPVTFQFIEGNGHTGLPDRDKIVDMYPQTRNPVPREITWLMTDPVIRNFFWVQSRQPAKKVELDASCRDNFVRVKTTAPCQASVMLDGRLVDFRRPIKLELNGKSKTLKIKPSLQVLAKTLQERGDPGLCFTAQIEVP